MVAGKYLLLSKLVDEMGVIVMELDLDNIYSNVHRINLPEGFDRYRIRSAIEQIKKLGLQNELHEFYPQGIFTGNVPKFFLFHQSQFTVVSIEIINNEYIINFETMDYSRINRLNFSISDESIQFCKLLIGLDTGNELVLHNADDTNEHWSYRFKDKIIDIYNLLK